MAVVCVLVGSVVGATPFEVAQEVGSKVGKGIVTVEAGAQKVAGFVISADGFIVAGGKAANFAKFRVKLSSGAIYEDVRLIARDAYFTAWAKSRTVILKNGLLDTVTEMEM